MAHERSGTPKRPTYPKALRRRAVAFAIKNSNKAAASKYGVALSTITAWRQALGAGPGARMPISSATETERRLDEIVAIMVAGDWTIGASHQALATKWGVARSTVEHLASEASRIVRRLQDPETVRGLIVSGLDDIRTRARGDKDYRAAVSALKLQAEMLGLLVERSESHLTIDPVAKMTDAEVQAALQAELAALAAKKGTP